MPVGQRAPANFLKASGRPAAILLGPSTRALVSLLLFPGTLVGGPFAYSPDPGPMGSTAMTASSLPAPGTVSRVQNGSSIDVSWTASTSYAVYDVYVSNNGGSSFSVAANG